MSYINLSKMQELVWRVEALNDEIENNPKYLVHSLVNQDKELELIIERIDFGHHKNFIIFGLRNLKLITEIYKRKTPFSTMTIIEITDAETQCIYFNGEEKQLEFLTDSRTSLVLGSEKQLRRQLDIALNDIQKTYNSRNTEIISMPYVKSMYKKEFNSVLDTLFEKLRTINISFGNDVEDILIGMDNYINNWSHVFKGMDCKYYKNEYKGKPAIIVGAGPSLDKNIDFLRSVKGKALILSVDGAMNTLIDKDIIPDVVSSIERVQLTANFYKNKEIPQDIIYVGPNVVLGSILERFSRIVFTGRQGDGLFRAFNDSIGFTNLEIGMNVSNVLISFARHLGCYPVIFVGLDLAYTNGKTHTEKFSENFDEKFMSNYKQNNVYVKGQNGEMIESFEHFMHTKSWIESMIAKDKEGLFINATEGGANIEGAINLKLTEAISSYCINNDVTSLSAMYDKIKSNENNNNKVNLTKDAIKFLGELNEYFTMIIEKSQNNYDKLLGSQKFGRVNLMEKQRGLMDETLAKNTAGRFIVQPIVISYRRDIHSFPMHLEKKDEIAMYERSLSYYKTLKDVSNKIIESIDLYIEVLKSHIA